MSVSGLAIGKLHDIVNNGLSYQSFSKKLSGVRGEEAHRKNQNLQILIN